MPVYHKPVLLKEILEFLGPEPGGVYVDCTLGGGGHSRAILERIQPTGRLVGIDQDQDSIDFVRQSLGEVSGQVDLVRGNFSELGDILERLGIDGVDGILFDLGVSSHQLDVAERGFSFAQDAPLDMRMSQENPITAADLVNKLPEKELADIIWIHSDERFSRRIARAIVAARTECPIATTRQLAEIVRLAIPPAARPKDIHPATRTFQALRIEVNAEMPSLDEGLLQAAEALKMGGRMCVISYHSLEDRKTKQFYRQMSGQCVCPPGLPVCACGAREILKTLTRKPVTPSPEEIDENPRARSAKLRVAERVG
jgi:16S rRNA (cytosine1402-N4)-methyltransferase